MEAQPLLSPLLDWLIVLLSVGLPGGGGGTHDPQLLRMVPPDAVVALEWGAQSPDAMPADHFQTWLADPEIRRATAGLSQLREQLRPYSSPTHDASLIGLRDRWPAVAERLWRYPGCFYVAWEPDVGGKLIPRAAIVLNVGRRTEEARQELLTVLPTWMLAEKGQSLIPNALWRFRQVGDHFIWSLGSESADRVTAALQQPANTPAANPALVAAVEQWDVPRPGHRLWINLPIDEWRQRNPALWERTPLTAVAELVPSWRSLSILGSDEHGLTSRTVWLSSPARPVATWFVPLTNDPLRSIPRDAHYAASVGLATSEIARWFSLAASHVPKLSPTAAEDLQQRVEAELGLSLSDDVLAAFGNTWTIYSAPSTGGALGVSPIICLDIRDRGRAEAVFAKAMDWLQRRIAASNSSSVSLQQEPFLDRSITTLSGWTPGGLALSPSFCLTDKHLLIAIQPQTLRAHLR
ncbi:MAG TPA: hypothetical protein VFG20_04180, partial [Planctomycetaceae bacterium]|nr:hypothetical protein [Planctomycetaceae bacterium]